MQIFILSQDLLVTSRVGGVTHSLQVPVTSCSSLSHLQTVLSESPAAVVAIDLTFRGLDVEEVIQWIRSEEAAITVIAFGPHVHVKKLANAEQAGCDQVYVRSEFFSQMKTIFSRALARHVTGEEDI